MTYHSKYRSQESLGDDGWQVKTVTVKREKNALISEVVKTQQA